MIHIDGLTEYQREMLDHMWSLKTTEEYQDWLSLLCEEDYNTALGLAQLLAYACLDELLERHKYNGFKETKQLLEKIM